MQAILEGVMDVIQGYADGQEMTLSRNRAADVSMILRGVRRPKLRQMVLTSIIILYNISQPEPRYLVR